MGAMKKTEKINRLEDPAYWEEILKTENTPWDDALTSYRPWVEFNDLRENKTALPIPEKTSIPPELIARIDPACDPRSGGIGGFGTTGLKLIRDAAGFTYSPSAWLEKMKNSRWDFVRVATPDGITIPRSVTNASSIAIYSNVSSIRNAGLTERAHTIEARRLQVCGWGIRTDPSSGGVK